MERLEQVRNRCLTKSVLAIQKNWRRHKRRIERRRNSAAVTIQSGKFHFLVWSCVFFQQNVLGSFIEGPITGARGVSVQSFSWPLHCRVEHWFFEHPRETKIDLKNRVFREIGCSTEGLLRRFESASVREIEIPLWGGSRGRRGFGRTTLKQWDIITHWLGLRMPEIPFPRTSILKIFWGTISLDLLQGTTFGGTYLQPFSLNFCIHPSHCIMEKAHTT